ncbi:hypothetical protein JCM8097_002298 [Rhodosporidiobolus ruineniae]
MPTYTGPLASKRKDELIEIHSALSLPPIAGRETKYALSEAIRAHLKSTASARSDRRFKGLWEHMPESRMGEDELLKHVGSGEAIDLDSASVREGSVASSAGGTSPRKSLDQLYSHGTDEEEDEVVAGSSSRGGGGRNGQDDLLPSSYRELIVDGAPHILDALLHSPTRAQQQDGLALIPSTKASRSLRRRASVHLRETVKSSAELVGEAQERLSSAWVVVVGIVAAELAWIVYEAVPYVDKTFGPHPWALFPFHPAHYTFRVPVLSVLIHPTFLSAMSLWVFSTLALPLTLATLLSFPSRSSSASASRSPSRRHHPSSTRPPIHPPNPVIFSLSRLALALLRGFVLPSSSPLPHAAHSALSTLTHALREIAAGGPGSLGLQGGRWSFEGAVQGYWGVMGVGMALAAGVAAYAEGRR